MATANAAAALRTARCSALFAVRISPHKFIVIRMGANPEPDQVIPGFYSKCSIVDANPNRPKDPHSSKMQGRVLWI